MTSLAEFRVTTPGGDAPLGELLAPFRLTHLLFLRHLA